MTIDAFRNKTGNDPTDEQVTMLRRALVKKRGGYQTAVSTVAVDVDGDGVADYLVTGVDADGDGIPDALQEEKPLTEMEKIMLDFERKVQRKEGRDATPEERALFVAKLEAYFAAQQAASVATVAVDLDGDGEADVLVTGEDLDGDGIPDALQEPVTEEPLWIPLSPREAPPPEPKPEPAAEGAFEWVDNGDGTKFLRRRTQLDSFSKLDTDGDGFISSKELNEASGADTMGAAETVMQQIKIEEDIALIDTDGDGQISRGEWEAAREKYAFHQEQTYVGDVMVEDSGKHLVEKEQVVKAAPAPQAAAPATGSSLKWKAKGLLGRCTGDMR